MAQDLTTLSLPVECEGAAAEGQATARMLDTLSPADAEQRQTLERAAAFAKDRRCVQCTQPIADARTALFIPALDRFACPGQCTTIALQRLGARLLRFGRLTPRRAAR